MKLDPKVYRKAAENVQIYNKNHDWTYFSCIAINRLTENYEYNRQYNNLFGTNKNKDGYLFINYFFISAFGYDKETQIHRGLMLDLMAELIEQGDL